MGTFALRFQRLPLLHTKPVLLVRDDQPQPRKDHRVLDERVGADEEIDLPGAERLQDLLFL